MTIIEVMQKHLQGRTLRGFAEALTESLKIDLSHAAVQYWSAGKKEPNTDFLLQCLVAYDDWRQSWAMEMLQAKLPEVFADGTLCEVLKKGAGNGQF